jgi:hypothetical protein
MGAAVRAGGIGCEGIEGRATVSASPEISNRRRSLARGTREFMMSRQLRGPQQHYGVFHAAPAIYQDEDRKHAEPGGTYPHCYHD